MHGLFERRTSSHYLPEGPIGAEIESKHGGFQFAGLGGTGLVRWRIHASFTLGINSGNQPDPSRIITAA